MINEAVSTGANVDAPRINRIADDESPVRRRALNLIDLARNPKLVPSGPAGWVHEDTKTADREAQLALAAAMLDLADALRTTSGRLS